MKRLEGKYATKMSTPGTLKNIIEVVWDTDILTDENCIMLKYNDFLKIFFQ